MTDPSGQIIGVIPARMDSSRFPGKPLEKLLGLPMVGHCFHRSRQAESLDQLVIATCDREIAWYIESIGGRAIMTSDRHETASDRTSEAVHILESEGVRVSVVVMIQGDEPLVRPEMIDEVVAPVVDGEVLVANLAARLIREDARDTNEIKVVTDRNMNALYMSRLPIPFERSPLGNNHWKQVCVIPFERAALEEFSALERTPLEVAESIDMLRFIENGIRVRIVPVDTDVQSVDTVYDLRRAEQLLADDTLVQSYL